MRSVIYSFLKINYVYLKYKIIKHAYYYSGRNHHAYYSTPPPMEGTDLVYSSKKIMTAVNYN